MPTLTNQTKKVKITLPRMHPAQRTIKSGMGRFNVICCGRRFGKDILAQDRIIYYALKHAALTAWFAPSYRMLDQNYKMLALTLNPIIARKRNNESIELVNGGSIDFWSLTDPNRALGHKYKHIIINEAAQVEDLSTAWDMIIRPMLADYQGSADFLSTPRGLNDFWSLYSAAVDLKDWERFTYPTSANPYIDPGEIEALRQSLPERVYRQEILAEFLESGSFFQNIRESAIIEHPDEPKDHEGHYIVMGVDWALHEDYTVITVACRDCNRVVDWWRGNQIDYSYQREQIVGMAKRWDVAGVLPERNSIGEVNIEILAQDITILPGHDNLMGWSTTALTKPKLIMDLASALEHSGFLVPLDYADELRSYQIDYMGAGHPKFAAPTGRHDDRVISLALAWQGMTREAWII